MDGQNAPIPAEETQPLEAEKPAPQETISPVETAEKPAESPAESAASTSTLSAPTNTTETVTPVLIRPRSHRFPIPSFPCELSYADLLEALPTAPTADPQPRKKVKSSVVIKNIFNRLEQYGALASPMDIGRHREDGQNEEFYDLDDGFIDDSDVHVEEVSDKAWKKVLNEGAYCLPAKDYKPEVEKQKQKRRKREMPKFNDSMYSQEAQNAIAALRRLYPRERKGKIHKQLRAAVISLLKSEDPKPSEPEVKLLLKSVTQLPADTLNEIYEETTKRLLADCIKAKYMLSVQALCNSLSRLCSSTEPVLTPDIGKQYAECQKLLAETLAAAKGLKASKGLEETELRAKTADKIKEASFSRFAEGDLAAMSGS